MDRPRRSASRRLLCVLRDLDMLYSRTDAIRNDGMLVSLVLASMTTPDLRSFSLYFVRGQSETPCKRVAAVSVVCVIGPAPNICTTFP